MALPNLLLLNGLLRRYYLMGGISIQMASAKKRLLLILPYARPTWAISTLGKQPYYN